MRGSGREDIKANLAERLGVASVTVADAANRPSIPCSRYSSTLPVSTTNTNWRQPHAHWAKADLP